MSSVASSAGWTGDRRSLQNDGQQALETSAYGSPPDHDKQEKKGAFEWFHKLRHDHKERSDKRDRAKSPPGSSHNLPSPQNLKQVAEYVPTQGHPVEVSRPVDTPLAQQNMSGDVTPQGRTFPPPGESGTPKTAHPVPEVSSPHPLTAPGAGLPPASREIRLVPQSPENSAAGQSIDQATSTLSTMHETRAQSATSKLAAETGAISPTGATPSRPHHGSSESTVTITPGQHGVTTSSANAASAEVAEGKP